MSVLKVAVHPGCILREEFMEPLSLSPIQLARHIGVPRTRIERIVHEQTSITVDTATRLAAALGTTAAFWMNLQTAYDLRTAPKVRGIKPIPAMA